MASGKELRTKIKSVENTKKITKAMEMISVHPFMKTHDAKSVGFIVVTTDKGLCGGLNTNLFRAVTLKWRETQAAGKSPLSVAIGSKGLGFLGRMGAKVVSHVTHLGDKPHLEKLIGPVKVLLDACAHL